MNGRQARTATERRFAAACAAAAALVTLIPYQYASTHAPDGYAFLGFVDHPYDMFSYLMKMTDGSLGHFFRIDKYATDPQPRTYFDLFWTPLGWVSAVTGVSLTAVFHLARLFWAFVLVACVLPFSALFCRRSEDRMLAVALVAFSSGLNFLLPDSAWNELSSRYQILPVDYWVQETITFESLLTSPEFCADTALLLGMTGFGYASLVGAARFPLHAAGACAAVLGFIHPIDVPSGLAILGVFALLRDLRRGGGYARSARRHAAIAAYAVVPLVYLSWLFSTNPVFVEWSKTTFISPNPWSYLLGYGVPLGLAAAGALAAASRRRSSDLFLLSFLVTVAVLLYVPVPFQRRLSLGWHVPICVLAAIAFRRLVFPKIRAATEALCAGLLPGAARAGTRRAYAVAAAALVAFTVPSNVVKLAKTASDPAKNPTEFCLTFEELEALSFLRAHASESDGVFCYYRLGQHVPQRTGANAYLAHWSETPRFETRRAELHAFFSAETTHETRRDLLSRARCQWLVRGPSEAALGPFDPATAPYLQSAYANRKVAVYRIVPGA